MEGFLPGENACITGGSSGIGLAIAAELVRGGYSVLLVARDPERLERAAGMLRPLVSHPGRHVEILPLDVSDGAAVQRVLGEALRVFGDPDLVVNCAGEAFPGYFDQIPDEVFESTIDVHVKGMWYVTRTVLDGLKRRRGTLVNVASIAGLAGVFGYTAYGAAKFAVVGFSDALRSELRPLGVRVAVLCPPDTETPGLLRENMTKPAETRAVSGNVTTLTAERVARCMIAGLRKKSFLIIPGSSARFAVFMIRHFTGLVRFIMDLNVRRVRRPIFVKRGPG